jgi:hypothetical protein
MPESAEGFKYIVLARDDLSGWVEGRAIVNNSAATVAKFLFKDVITDARNGSFVDSGPVIVFKTFSVVNSINTSKSN